MSDRTLPTFDELPRFHEFSGCAWDVWGKGDQLGTVNLLTEKVVAEAMKEVKLGKMIGLNLPINFPGKPCFGRQPPLHNLWMCHTDTINDDSLTINTQHGTQWDGLRHFGLLKHSLFYNNTPATAFKRGHLFINDPSDIVESDLILGMQNWAKHGICGRGVLLDMVEFYTDGGKKPLPYDPWTSYAVSAKDLEACAKKQGVTFRTGDILLLRVGFVHRYFSATKAEREALAGKPETFAGIEQSEDMKRFLWNNHFAACASDQPTLERWPDPTGFPEMHQTLLALWGMPIGEFFELEDLAKACKEAGRYTFFFSSWPLNVLGGVGSPPNAAETYKLQIKGFAN